MRHIARNQITSIAADSQDGNFPASNLLDGRPGRLWKAGGLTRNATLTMEMRGGVSDVALFGANAREATATAEDPCAVTFGINTNARYPMGILYITATKIKPTMKSKILNC